MVVGKHNVVVEHNIEDSTVLIQLQGVGLWHASVEVVLLQEAMMAAVPDAWLQAAAQGVWLQVVLV